MVEHSLYLPKVEALNPETVTAFRRGIMAEKGLGYIICYCCARTIYSDKRVSLLPVRVNHTRMFRRIAPLFSVKFFINFYVCLVLGFEPDFFETFGGLKKNESRK